MQFKKNFMIGATVTHLLLTSLPSLAFEQQFSFCHSGNLQAEAVRFNASNLLLDISGKKADLDLSKNLILGADQKSFVLEQIMAPGDCVEVKAITKASGASIRSFQVKTNGQWSGPEALKQDDELSASAILTDISELQSGQLASDATRSEQLGRLEACQKTGEDCSEIKNEIITAEANATILEKQKNNRLAQLKKLLGPVGIGAFATLSAGLVAQLSRHRGHWQHNLNHERCQLNSPGACEALKIKAEQSAKEVLNQDQGLKEEWQSFAKNHVATLEESERPNVSLRLPAYLEGKNAIGNEQVTILAAVDGAMERDIKSVVVKLDGKSVPAKFFPRKGHIRAELNQLPPAMKGLMEIEIEGKEGPLAKKQFEFKKDSVTPEVKITQSKKAFEVSVIDQGLGFSSINMGGSNVKLERPLIEFAKPETKFETKVKVTGTPASLTVKASKPVVKQNVMPINGQEIVAKTDEAGRLSYPEEKSPESNAINFEELRQVLNGGRTIRGQCCRDQLCMFCHPNTLLGCRQKGFSYWKFNDGDNYCYKIKPL